METRNFNTEFIARWPSGDYKDIMQLKLSSGALSERFGLKFLRDKDDLDWANFFRYKDELVGPILLIEYDNIPGGGISVQVDKEVSTEMAVKRIRDTFQISDKDIL